MPESEAQKNTADRARGIGKFNQGGKLLKSGDKEFYQDGGKWKVRDNPQTVADNAEMEKNKQDPNSTKRDGVDKEAKVTAKAEAKTPDDWELAGTGGKDVTLAEGSAGKLEGQYTAGKFEAKASAEGSADADGVELKLGAGAKVTAVGGKLVYTYPIANMEVLGETMDVSFGAELSAEVAAEANGEVGLSAKKNGNGVDVGASGGGVAFAGAKAGFKVFGALKWHDPTTGKPEDVIQGFAGAEGWAGAAAAAVASVALSPKIKATGYYGAAVGVGGAVKMGVEIHAINAAKLGFILLTRGVTRAWTEISHLASNIWDWLLTSAIDVVDDVGVLVGAVWSQIKSDYGKVVDLWHKLGADAKELWDYVKGESWAYIGKLLSTFGSRVDSLWKFIWEDCRMEDLADVLKEAGGMFGSFIQYIWEEADYKQLGRMIAAASGGTFFKMMDWFWDKCSMEQLAKLVRGIGSKLGDFLSYIWDKCSFSQMVRLVKAVAGYSAGLAKDVAAWIWNNVEDAKALLWEAL